MISRNKYSCINCGCEVKSLFKKYNESVLKLTECVSIEQCCKIADKYVEYDIVIIIIDLVLLQYNAYRHILFNLQFKNFWKLSVILLLTEAYYEWAHFTPTGFYEKRILMNETSNHSNPFLDKIDVEISDFQFYGICLTSSLKNGSYILILYFLTLIYSTLTGQNFASLMMIWKTMTISSFGIFLFLPSLIWDTSDVREIHLSVVAVYTTMSQLIAYTVMCKCPKYWSVFAISTAYYYKTFHSDAFIHAIFHRIKQTNLYAILFLSGDMADSVLRPFTNGFWTWDDTNNSLAFISRDVKEAVPGLGTVVSGQKPATKNTAVTINFNDAVDELGQAQFRRLYMRRIKPNEPHIVTIQDIKDVALYTAERKDLTPEFISFMHTRKMDEFLRSLIVYFQYYLQVWDNLMLRREEAKRKLRQPIVTVLENVVRDDLADLRSMVAKYYSYICMGLGDSTAYYHMNNRNNVSLSDKDRHLYECVLNIAAKIVWIALLRRNFTLIELELNRIFRTSIFNIMARLRQSQYKTLPEEDRILFGKAFKCEKKLKTKSPAVQELVFDDHNFRMLAIGELRAEPFGPRMNYLEAVYTAPEEILFKIGVGVGILGLDKSYLNPILKPKEGMGKRIHIPEFKIPTLQQIGDPFVSETLPDTPSKYAETPRAQLARLHQCKMWRRYVMGLERNDDGGIKSMSTTNSTPVSVAEEFIED